MLHLARVPVLETARLGLRGSRVDDLDPFAAMLADPEVARLKGLEGGAGREQCWAGLARILGHWALRDFGLFVVEERGSGAFVGTIGVIEPLGWPRPELTWTVARPRWNRGFATEAAAAVRDWAFEILPDRELLSMVPPDNPASRRVAEKIGGMPRGEVRLGGGPVGLYAFGRSRWVTPLARRSFPLRSAARLDGAHARRVDAQTRAAASHARMAVITNGRVLPPSTGRILSGPENVFTEAWSSIGRSRLPPVPS